MIAKLRNDLETGNARRFIRQQTNYSNTMGTKRLEIYVESQTIAMNELRCISPESLVFQGNCFPSECG